MGAVLAGTVAVAAPAQANDPWNGSWSWIQCPYSSGGAGQISFTEGTSYSGACVRFTGTWHAMNGYYSGQPATFYINGDSVQGHVKSADNEVNCQADLYTGYYGTGSVHHQYAYTSSPNVGSGYLGSLGWNC
ncbi:hypothetical protein EDD99_3563 [Streptomyces sp. 846.5]|nr:hypothetical protein EDD99_3563 [Streptomyces sp. 846.5]